MIHGLKPYPAYKDSGVPWLGKVREGWDVRRQRNAVEMHVSSVDKHTTKGERPVRYHLALLRPRDGLMSGAFLLRVQQCPSVAYQYHVLANGVTRYGLSHDAIKSVQIPVPPLPEFLVAAMNTRYFRIQVEQAISGAEGLANNLLQSLLKVFRLAVPPAPEAHRFAVELNAVTGRLDLLRDRTQREIALLHELCTRLIADVVTGKLDVREAAARLPDEADEPEPLDKAEAPDEGADESVADLDAAPEEAEA